MVQAVQALIEQANGYEEARMTAATRRHASSAEAAKHRELVKRQLKKVHPCDGSTRVGVRTWLKQLSQTANYFSVASRDSDLHTMVQDTATGGLLTEYERFMSRQPNRNNVPWTSLQVALREAFLGPDEEEALRGEVERLRQGAQEPLPDFNRRFDDAAEDAYPASLRQPAEDLLLTNLYLAAINTGPIVDHLFDADPRIVTLTGAITAAAAVWARRQRRERVITGSSHTVNMEVGALTPNHSNEPPMREVLSTMQSAIKESERHNKGMESSLSKMCSRLEQLERASTSALKNSRQSHPHQETPQPPITPRGTRRPNGSQRSNCFGCGKPGHFERDCWKKTGHPASSHAQHSSKNVERPPRFQ